MTKRKKKKLRLKKRITLFLVITVLVIAAAVLAGNEINKLIMASKLNEKHLTISYDNIDETKYKVNITYDDLIGEINERIAKNERVLVTTLTIRMAEELTAYLKGVGIKVAYLHTEVKTLERLKIIKELRQGKYDVLVGINLLREGIDLPEVSMIAIMDADKQGFLRSYRSLIQIIGRCARNAEGKVIMYADTVSEAMDQSIKETNRRREIQDQYNKEHGIVPKTVIKKIKDVVTNEEMEKLEDKKLTKQDKEQILAVMEEEMRQAAANLDFEKAAELRDLIFEMKSE